MTDVNYTGSTISGLPELDKLTGTELIELIGDTLAGMTATPSGKSNFKFPLAKLLSVAEARAKELDAAQLKTLNDAIATSETQAKDREDQKLAALSTSVDERLKGLSGGTPDGIRFKGTKGSEGELPDPKESKTGDIWSIQKHLWALTDGKWLDLGDFSGQAGSNAYVLAQANGFTGTLAEWLASLRGSDGIGLKILGSMQSPSNLPMDSSNKNGDAYIIQEKMYVWDGSQWSVVGQVGPQGASVYETAQKLGFKGTEREYLESLKGKSVYTIAVENGYKGSESEYIASLKGEKGDVGPQGPKGDQGEPGAPSYAVHILGRVDDASKLPATGAVGDAYFVDRNLYVWDGSKWMDLGVMQGEQGYSAYQIWVAKGGRGTETEFLESLKGAVGPAGAAGKDGAKGDKGDPGDDAFAIAQKQGWSGSRDDWLASLRGPAGATLTPKGQVAKITDLPHENQKLNDMWTVAENSLCYAWDGAQWVVLGQFSGTKGEKGDTGPQGPKGERGADGAAGIAGKDGAKGDKGDKGDPGTGLAIEGTVATKEELPASITEGHGYMVGDHLYIYVGGKWLDAGSIQGPAGKDGVQGKDGAAGVAGPKGDAGEKGEQGNVWIVLKRDPQVTDGQPGDYYFDMSTQKTYLKTSTTTWSYLGIIGGGNVYDVPMDGNRYVRVDGEWKTSTLYVPPTEEGRYVFSPKAGWIRFNDYDLAVSNVTGECDCSLSNVFRFDATKSVDVSLKNLPAERAKVLLFVFEGSGGTITWKSSVSWQNNTVPTYGAKRTNIVVLWDGYNLTGNTAHKIN